MKLVADAPTLLALLAGVDLNAELAGILAAVPGPDVDGNYRHWEELRGRTPPAGLTRESWWLGLKFRRSNLARELPLISADGVRFNYGLPDSALEQLHWIDQHAGGEILVSEGVTDPGQRQRYLVSSLIEESITSSQLEGASVTRKVAKEMIRSGRSPRDRGERMILNNYRAMTRLREFAERPLDVAMVMELHEILTDGTLDNPDAAGRIQRADEVRVRVFDPEDRVVHTPPAADDLPDRLEAMVRFANEETPGHFVHPVVRAIVLHLWLAYDHPFEDGNGRTARALFYWAMLRRDYWMFEYLSISSLLVKAPIQYARSFLLTEHDEFDATYFILYQLKVIFRAVDQLMDYLRRSMTKLRRTASLLRETDLNARQVELVSHALDHPDFQYTAKGHARSHGVTEQSARNDLHDLVARGLLEQRTAGRKQLFYPASDLRERFELWDGGDDIRALLTPRPKARRSKITTPSLWGPPETE